MIKGYPTFALQRLIYCIYLCACVCVCVCVYPHVSVWCVCLCACLCGGCACNCASIVPSYMCYVWDGLLRNLQQGLWSQGCFCVGSATIQLPTTSGMFGIHAQTFYMSHATKVGA